MHERGQEQAAGAVVNPDHEDAEVREHRRPERNGPAKRAATALGISRGRSPDGAGMAAGPLKAALGPERSGWA